MINQFINFVIFIKNFITIIKYYYYTLLERKICKTNKASMEFYTKRIKHLHSLFNYHLEFYFFQHNFQMITSSDNSKLCIINSFCIHDYETYKK